ncbi:MAG: EscU/YscU/HrcU family type III secretion system export apparatus switch protein [Polyangiaceae bacterium]
MAEKTEQPTPKRLRKLREQGDVAVSSALSQAVGFGTGVALLPGAFTAAATTLAELVRVSLEGRELEPTAIGPLVLGLSVPLIAAVAFAAMASSVVQSGGLFAPQRLSPSLDRLNFVSGLRSLVSAPRLLSLVRSFVASAALGLLAFSVLRKTLPRLLVPGLLPTAAAAGLGALTLLRGMTGIALALGFIDSDRQQALVFEAAPHEPR